MEFEEGRKGDVSFDFSCGAGTKRRPGIAVGLIDSSQVTLGTSFLCRVVLKGGKNMELLEDKKTLRRMHGFSCNGPED